MALIFIGIHILDGDDTLLCALDWVFDDATVYTLCGKSYCGKRLKTAGSLKRHGDGWRDFSVRIRNNCAVLLVLLRNWLTADWIWRFLPTRNSDFLPALTQLIKF